MQWPMMMATVMMRSERTPPSMPQSQDKTHSMIGDFTKNTVPISDNDLQQLQCTNARLDSRMPALLEVEIWTSVLLWMFVVSLFFTSLLPHFFTCFDLGPVQTASTLVYTTSGDKSS